MSDRTSHATQPSESDFHDSHPLDSDSIKSEAIQKTTPSIGDLTSIETSAEASNAEMHSVGDISNIENTEKSEVLGDMSLLDEAFAEMDENNVQNNTDIPTLNESITTPTESKIISPDNDSSSIPLLDQEATIYAEMLKPASDASATLQSSEIETDGPTSESGIEDTPLFDAPDVQSNANISAMNTALETAAALINENENENENETEAENTNKTESESVSTSFEPEATPTTQTEFKASQINEDSALEALLNDDDISEENVNFTTAEHLSQISESLTNIDEKIAIANSESELVSAEESVVENTVKSTVENGAVESSIIEDHAVESSALESEIDINEVPIAAMDSAASTMSGNASEISEFPTHFAENLHSQPTTPDSEETEALSNRLTELDGTEISEFNPEVDLNSAAIPQTSHQVDITTHANENKQEQERSNLDISIPFELHSQLSHKIDELVLQATSSITDELHKQLTSRLDGLLTNAVESILPKLVNHMASELRNDVNDRIKHQLPSIIDDVLNNTRLSK